MKKEFHGNLITIDGQWKPNLVEAITRGEQPESLSQENSILFSYLELKRIKIKIKS